MKYIKIENDNNARLFDSHAKDHRAIVKYHAPWCGHCNNFKPEWEETKQHLNTIKDKASGHVVTVDDKLMQRLPCKQPSGFPTLSLYDGKEWKEDYGGARSKDALVEYLMNNMGSKPKPKIQTQKGSRKGSRSARHGRRSRRGRHRTRVRHNKLGELQWGGKKRKTKKQKYKRRKSRTMRRKRRR